MNEQLSQPDAESLPARTIRIVLVDDSARASAALARWLEQFPPLLIVGRAANGLRGFALAAELQPDLVITDLHMPGLGGLQLVELLRQNYPAMRSIVISAHDGPALQAASLQQGADAFITKQRLPQELPPLLNRLFPDPVEPAIQ